MTFWEIVLIGIALSMDAAAVSMTNGMIYSRITKHHVLAMAFAFGLFQALMPLAGYFTGGLFSTIITRYSGFLVFLILGILGIKMLVDGLKNPKEPVLCKETAAKPCFTYKLLFWQAIATSIDAFAIGIGFSAIQVTILPAVAIIGLTTFLLSMIAFLIGKKFGDILGSAASIIGGVILVALAIKALF